MARLKSVPFESGDFRCVKVVKVARKDLGEHLERAGSCQFPLFVYFSCMATKTITLELDAYERLRQAKRGGESFTEVVRRAVWVDAPATGEALRNYYRNGGSGVSSKYLDAVEEAAKHDPIPDDPWA